jgi:predicted TIM-barrel enzyme
MNLMRNRAARDTSGQVYVRIEYAGGQMAADVAADVFVPQVESGLNVGGTSGARQSKKCGRGSRSSNNVPKVLRRGSASRGVESKAELKQGF